MTKGIWTAMCGAIIGVATAGLAAQTPQTPTQTTPQTTPQQSSAPSTEKITVTGCLKQAPGSSAESAAVGTTGTATTGTAGTAGTTTPAPVPATTDAPKYVLADAVKSSADAAGATTTAEAAAPSAPSAPQTYRLIANMAALTPHVGKKVELVGTIDPNPASSDTASPSNTSMPTLRVESGKIVAASCTP
jgi:hypothetical protein